MQPVRRRVRRHFGLTAKNVAVRSHRPWYFQSLLALMFVLIGFGLCYWMLHRDDIETIQKNLHDKTLESKALEAKLVAAQRQQQVQVETDKHLVKDLKDVQDENIKLKEELLFYKNMLGKRSK